jgi:integrase
MLDRCKVVAERAGLDPTKFDLKTFRSTFATRMLRQGFDVRTVQHWMGHKSLETTMRYLVPATDVHSRLDEVGIPGVPPSQPAGKRATAEQISAPERSRAKRIPA